MLRFDNFDATVVREEGTYDDSTAAETPSHSVNERTLLYVVRGRAYWAMIARDN